MQTKTITRVLSCLLVLDLVTIGAWFGATGWWWLNPRPFVPDAREVALGLFMVIKETLLGRPSRQEPSTNLPESIGICGFDAPREIYYFRALASRWDLRAGFLEWRLRGFAVPWMDYYDWEDSTSWLGSIKENLVGYFVHTFGESSIPSLFVAYDCQAVVANSPELLIHIVGASPVVTVGYWVPRASKGEEGQVFFLAVEFVSTANRWQEVYAIGLQPLGPMASARGWLRPWVVAIPEGFWRKDFDRWPRAGWRLY